MCRDHNIFEKHLQWKYDLHNRVVQKDQTESFHSTYPEELIRHNMSLLVFELPDRYHSIFQYLRYTVLFRIYYEISLSLERNDESLVCI